MLETDRSIRSLLNSNGPAGLIYAGHRFTSRLLSIGAAEPEEMLNQLMVTALKTHRGVERRQPRRDCFRARVKWVEIHRVITLQKTAR